MRKTIAILFTFLIYNVNAQTSGQLANNQMSTGGGSNDIVNYLLGDVKTGSEKRAIKEADIQGSAYTSEDFLPGQLYYKDQLESNVFYRYNAYAEEIEIKNGNIPDAPIRGLQRDKNIKLVKPDGKAVSFKTFIDKKGLTQNGYLIELGNAGKYTFYKRTDVKYTQPMKSQNSFVPAQPARFSKFTEYYLESTGKNRIDELELKNKKLIKLVEESDKEKLKSHLKANKIKIKDENDVLNILSFLNQ